MEMTDKKQYRENLIFNTKYLIRDVFNSEELNNIKEFIDEDRRVKNSEINYFDHPSMGVIVKIDKT